MSKVVITVFSFLPVFDSVAHIITGVAPRKILLSFLYFWGVTIPQKPVKGRDFCAPFTMPVRDYRVTINTFLAAFPVR